MLRTPWAFHSVKFQLLPWPRYQNWTLPKVHLYKRKGKIEGRRCGNQCITVRDSVSYRFPANLKNWFVVYFFLEFFHTERRRNCNISASLTLMRLCNFSGSLCGTQTALHTEIVWVAGPDEFEGEVCRYFLEIFSQKEKQNKTFLRVWPYTETGIWEKFISNVDID